MAIPVAKVTDPLLDIVERVYYAKMGAASTTHQQVQAVSYSDSQVRWSVYTPSVNIGVDRRFYVEQEFLIQFGQVTVGAPPVTRFPLVAEVFTASGGLRQFPLASVLESVQLKLNNSTVSTNLDDVVHALMRYGSNPDERNFYLSGSPAFPDQFSEFANAGGAFEISVAGGRNPFAEYVTNNVEVTRNLKVWVTAVTLAAGGTQVENITVRLREPVLIPPLNWSDRDVLCLFGIQTIDLTYSYSDLNKVAEGVFVAVGGVAIPTTVRSTSVPGGAQLMVPRLHLFYVSPQINQPIPKLLHYPFYELGRYITTGRQALANPFPMLLGATPFTVPAGAQQSTSVNNIQLQSIPKRMYIYVQERRSNQTIGSPNVWARIDNISVNWNSVAGKLSTAESYDLYKMSVKNGLTMSWPQWSRFCGSVLCVEPPTDLGLSPLEASGSRGSYQLQYNLTYTNLQNRVVDYDVYTVVVAEGFMTINDALVSQDVGVLTETAIADAPFMPAGTFNEIRNMYGGGFFQDLWRGIKKAGKVVADVGAFAAPIVGKVASMIPDPRAQGIARAADVVGSVAQGVRGAMGSGVSGGRRSGGARSGGAVMSRRSLTARARR